MKFSNPNKAWDILTARKAKRTENRTAFLAALIMERANYALPKGEDVQPVTPRTAEMFAVELVRLARSIKALCEADCNYGLSPLQETRQRNLEKRFADIANALGFDSRTGGDPRGTCAYLIDGSNPNDGDGWGNGWAVYR